MRGVQGLEVWDVQGLELRGVQNFMIYKSCRMADHACADNPDNLIRVTN